LQRRQVSKRENRGKGISHTEMSQKKLALQKPGQTRKRVRRSSPEEEIKEKERDGGLLYFLGKRDVAKRETLQKRKRFGINL